jgi:hypothetical protein
MESLLQVEELTATRPGRLRAAWRAAHEPVAGVSRRMQLVAYAVPLTVLPNSPGFTVMFVASEIRGTTIRGDDLPAGSPSQATGWEAAWFCLCYAPLLLWGPLLAVLTVAYWKRRRAAEKVPAAA